MRRSITLTLMLLAGSPMLGLAMPAGAQSSFGVAFAPPALPIYDQPPIPAPDYIWAPGYWAWDDEAGDYFWVPGTWIAPPRPGLLWTPPWWEWQDGYYLFHTGYWGPHVGFYGGVPYGFGYTGTGFQGGYWRGGHVYYNNAVTNITNVHVTNVYHTVIVNRTTTVSYNGGPGGVQARPTAQERAVAQEPHVQPTPLQEQHLRSAQGTRQFFASANRGHPPVAATSRPARFDGPGIVPTRQAAFYAPHGQGVPTGGRPGPAPTGPDRRGPAPQAMGQAMGQPGPRIVASPDRVTVRYGAGEGGYPAAGRPPAPARPAHGDPRANPAFAQPGPSAQPHPMPPHPMPPHPMAPHAMVPRPALPHPAAPPRPVPHPAPRPHPPEHHDGH